MSLPTLTSERLSIRPLTMDDLADCHRLNVEIDWVDRERSDAENLERKRQWLEWTVRSYEQLSQLYQPPYGERAIVRKADGQLVGLVGLVPLLCPFSQLPALGGAQNAAFSAEVGLFWAVRPCFQKQGYASEAGACLARAAFEHLQLGRILACTEHDNEGSIAVMRKLGMKVERNPQSEPLWFQTVGILDRTRQSGTQESSSG